MKKLLCLLLLISANAFAVPANHLAIEFRIPTFGMRWIRFYTCETRPGVTVDSCVYSMEVSFKKDGEWMTAQANLRPEIGRILSQHWLNFGTSATPITTRAGELPCPVRPEPIIPGQDSLRAQLWASYTRLAQEGVAEGNEFVEIHGGRDCKRHDFTRPISDEGYQSALVTRGILLALALEYTDPAYALQTGP